MITAQLVFWVHCCWCPPPTVTGGSRWIRIWIIRIPDNSKFYGNHTPVSYVLICLLNWNSLPSKEFSFFELSGRFLYRHLYDANEIRPKQFFAPILRQKGELVFGGLCWMMITWWASRMWGGKVQVINFTYFSHKAQINLTKVCIIPPCAANWVGKQNHWATKPTSFFCFNLFYLPTHRSQKICMNSSSVHVWPFMGI